MLSCSDVYYLLLDELRADKRGLSVELDEFNRLIRLVNQEIFDEYISSFESGQESSDDLGSLKVHNWGIDLVAGVGSLPSNASIEYYRLIGKPRILDGTTYRNVDVVSTYEQACRDEDYLTQASTTYPTCTIGGVDGSYVMQIRVKPTTITKVWIDFLMAVPVPFLDYMITTATLVPTLFEETTTPQPLGVGTVYRTGTVGSAGGTVTSVSKDFWWGDGDLSRIITKLVNRVAKQLPDELLLQTSSAEQAKFDSE